MEPVEEESVPVVVSLDDDHLDRFDDVAAQLTDHGLRIDQVLRALGTVTGRIDPSRIVDIEGVDGVSSVEEEHVVQLPPPDAPVQ